MKKQLLLALFISLSSAVSSQSKIDYPIYFAYKVAEMDTTEEKRLGFFLKNFDSFTIDSLSIRAYCDDRGRKKINDTLSQNRANYILQFVKSKVPYPIANTTSGLGSLGLIGQQQIDSQRSLNRRAELELFYSMKKSKNITKGKALAKPKQDSLLNKLPLSSPVNSEPTIQDFLKSAKKGETVDLKIYFEGSSSVILKASAPEMVNLLNYMKANPGRKIKITGHIYDEKAPTDKDAYDLFVKDKNLSTNRAKKIFTYLTNNGIEESRVSFEGMAAKYPRGGSPEEDRRVEIEVIE